jgi:hypothetical protein
MYNYADFELKTAIKTICSIGESLFLLFSEINVKVQKGKDVISTLPLFGDVQLRVRPEQN